MRRARPRECEASTGTPRLLRIPRVVGQRAVLLAHHDTRTPPLALPLDFDALWNFTVTTNGAPCLSYSDREDGFVLTVGDDDVSKSMFGRSLDRATLTAMKRFRAIAISGARSDGGSVAS